MRRYPRVLGRFRQGLVGELEDGAGAVRSFVHSRFAVCRREGQPRSIDGRRLLASPTSTIWRPSCSSVTVW